MNRRDQRFIGAFDGAVPKMKKFLIYNDICKVYLIVVYFIYKNKVVSFLIYITGDTHIPVDIGKLSAKKFPEQRNLIKNDYLIICGDFGGLWDGSKEEKYWLDWLNSRNFTTFFVDGNHENFDMLNSLPTEEFCGGTVHKINDSVYHLIRGMVYTIDNKKIFTFGGAESHDKNQRT